MDYEKKYKETLERARQIQNTPYTAHWDVMKELVEDLFPELAESKNERIRKHLIGVVELYYGKTDEQEKKDCLAWLENQGEKRSGCSLMEAWKDMRFEAYAQASGNRHEPNYSDDTTKMFSLNDIDEIIEKISEQKPTEEYNITGIGSKNAQGKLGEMIKKLKPVNEVLEQKPSGKIEPKFKVGDWVIDKQGIVHQIVNVIENVTNHTYAYDIVGGGYFNDNIEGVRLWTIQDAKDGDVLSWDDSKCIAIFKNIYDEDSFNSYGFVGGCTGTFESRQSYHDIEGAHPASKEQYVLLFQKMKEAGYEWDAEKKELKKVEQKSSWSEEDETKIKSIIAFLKSPALCAMDSNKGIIDENIKYLKSLKERVLPQPKQEWKQENTSDLTDFENTMMHIGGSFFGDNAGLDPNDTNSIKEQANLLLELVPKREWSKEDKVMLDKIIDFFENGTVKLQHDLSLYASWLKSLKDRYTWKPSDEHYELEEFAKIVRGNLTGISKAVQKLFEAKYLQLTGNKMYGGFKD